MNFLKRGYSGRGTARSPQKLGLLACSGTRNFGEEIPYKLGADPYGKQKYADIKNVFVQSRSLGVS